VINVIIYAFQQGERKKKVLLEQKHEGIEA